jgi:hypothetical protein
VQESIHASTQVGHGDALSARGRTPGEERLNSARVPDDEGAPPLMR